MEDNRLSSMSDRDRKMMGLENSAEDDDEDEKETPRARRNREAAERAEREDKSEKKEAPKEEPEAEPEAAEAEEAAEDLEADPEVVADEEVHEIIEQYIDARADDLREDLETAPPDSPEAAAALADAALLEAIREAEATTAEEMDAALEATVESLDLTPPEAEPDVVEDDTTVTTTSPPPPPPLIPTIPPASASAPGPTPIGASLPPMGPRFESAPSEPEEPEETTDNWRPNRRRAGQLLLMGGVGYLLGRRRGRIRTEAKLLPIQEKLENEVKSLHDMVAEREAKIRQLAAEKVEEQPEAIRPVVVNTLAAKVEKQLPVPEQAPSSAEAPAIQPEALGKFALPGSEVVAPKSAEVMNLPELLVIADRIERDGVSVKEMYARGRLDVEGLRRVVREYLRGERIDRVLEENLRPLESLETLPPNLQALRDDTVTAAHGMTQTMAQSAAQPMQSPNLPTAPGYGMSLPPAPLQTSEVRTNQIAVGIGLVGGLLILLILWLL